eukprot:571024-Prymnesium_polylepis.1
MRDAGGGVDETKHSMGPAQVSRAGEGHRVLGPAPVERGGAARGLAHSQEAAGDLGVVGRLA